MDIKGTTIQHAADGISDFSEAGFARFGEQAKHLGFDEVLKRRWDPGVFLDIHTHSFAVQALVVEGSMWLDLDGRSQELGPGSRFEVDHDLPHAERYGPDGAVFWVARRNRHLQSGAQNQ
jgi:hypothetical protein